MAILTNVIFLYSDSLKRDFSTCYIIKKKLDKSGIKSIICSRRNLNKFLKILIPKKLFLIGQIDIIPKGIINSVIKGNSKIYFMPAEGYGFDSEYDVMYPDDYTYNHLTSIYFWGEHPYRWFKKNRKIDDINKLKITGYNKFPINRAYSEKNTRDKNKIGFIGRFPATNDLYKRSNVWFFLIEDLNKEIDKTLSRSQTETKALWLYMKVFKRIFESSNITISYRPHPNEDPETYNILSNKFGKRFELNNDYDVADWASKCCKIVGLASTTFIDASMTNTPVISIDKLIDTTDKTAEFDPILKSVYDSSHNPDNMNDFFSILFDKNLNIVKNRKFQEVLNKNFMGKNKIVFDTIFEDLIYESRKSILFDQFFLKILYSVDLILSMYQRLFNKKSTQFDYSYFFHKTTSSLKTIEKKINNNY